MTRPVTDSDMSGPEGRTSTGDCSPYRLSAEKAAELDAAAVLGLLEAADTGLTARQAANRRKVVGPNEVAQARTTIASIVLGQLRSPLLVLLFVTAALSAVVGEPTNAIIILAILCASVTLGAVNDFRGTTAAAALAANARQRAQALRDGHWQGLDARDLVPGDVVQLIAGAIVPADLRLLSVQGLRCDESALTGEALPVEKAPAVVPAGRPLAEWSSCALSGTVVATGTATGVVVATGRYSQWGTVQQGLRGRPPRTSFERGLQRFSTLLAVIAFIVSGAVLVINLLLGRGVIDALLFAAAIAVGITPQLLPAVVSTSLASGARTLGRRKVLVKHLVAIENLGDLDVLVTDKTGTLTQGRYRLSGSFGVDGTSSPAVAASALLASTLEVAADGSVTGDPLDVALWQATPRAAVAFAAHARLGVLPFDHERRRVTVLVQGRDGARIVVKGAPESVLALCPDVTADQRASVDAQLLSGGRVIAVAVREAGDLRTLSAADENAMNFAGLLVFDDPAKPGVNAALTRLDRLGVRVVIASGDSIPAAQRLAEQVGLGAVTLSGGELDGLSDERLATVLIGTSVLARVSPEQKARVVRVLQSGGRAVGFLGDGVNDALALHQADVGLSVDTAADVARDAADVVLLDKSLDVVADGITEGRRIFANTMKYVLMGTSSNFGNILSAAAASALLPFLPMLPSQLLLNNLLYDTGQLAIPTDHVDDDQLTRPGQWDLGVIRRFMLLFGPLSSLFDFVTFGVLLGPLHADAMAFRSGWFIESLTTQTLVVFAIRTRRVPFLRSRPSRALALSISAVVVVAALIPLAPFAARLGFTAPSGWLYLSVAALSAVYLVLVDLAKGAVFRR